LSLFGVLIIKNSKKIMTETILVIEDNEDMRQNTSEILELASYNVITAANGKEGVDLARKNKPDLILCDIMMPELDGYGVLRALENAEKVNAIPFVFITAKAEKSDFRKGMDLGADDYLTKPFNGEDLLRVVGARIKKSKARDLVNASQVLNDFVSVSHSMEDFNVLSHERTIKKIRKRGVIFMEGNTSQYLYYIVSGKVKTFRSNEEGKELIRQIYKEGDFFGYISLLNNDSQHKESATAIEKSEIALIPKQDFYQLLYSSNDVSLRFLKVLTSKFYDLEEKLLKLAYNSARKKVAEALLFVKQKYTEEDTKPFPVYRENISAIAGISPESVSRNMKDFKVEGLIETFANGTVKILDQKRLENLKN